MNLLEAMNWKLPYLQFTSDSFSCETFTGIFISTDVNTATEVNIQHISWILMVASTADEQKLNFKLPTSDGHQI